MCASDKARFIAGEVSDHRSDIFGIATALDRLSLIGDFVDHDIGCIAIFTRNFQRRSKDIGLDETGADRVDPYVKFRKFRRSHFRKVQNANLGNCIGRRRITRAKRGDAGGIHNRGARAALHMRHRITDTHGDRAQQQVHRPVPAFGGDFVDRRTIANGAGIVEDDIDAAGFFGCQIHQCLYVIDIADIGAFEDDLAV